MTTARDINREIRGLHPRPVRLSVRDITCAGGPEFLIRLPRSSGLAPADWLSGYLTRRLRQPVTVTEHRTINRRDCGHDIEFLAAIGEEATP